MDPPDQELLAINTATVRSQWKLRQCIEGCARHAIRGIAPWRGELAELGLKQAARMIRDHGLLVTGLCGGGMFPAADRNGRRTAIDDNLRAIDEAAALEARCMVLAVGGLPAGSKDLIGAREMVRDGIGAVLDHARASGVPLAIEPQHPMYCAELACVNTMAQANDLCDELGSGLGIAFDLYHVWWDPDLAGQIERAGESRILAFQICDWLAPTRDLLADRGMMGEGVIDIPLVRSWVEAQGYRGLHEVEIFSALNWWRRDADEVLATCKVKHQTAC